MSHTKYVVFEIKCCYDCPFLKYTKDNGEDEIEKYCSKTNKTIYNGTIIDEECPLKYYEILRLSN